MLVSMKWIQDYVDLDGIDIENLIHRFTLSTAEVEDIYHYGKETKDVVVAKIVSVENHPDSKKLHLLKVDAGDGIYDCVCGAPNVHEGKVVAFAKAGGMVNGMPIKVATVAGYESRGMCCSESELGISADNSGLMSITDDIPLGTDLKDVYDIEDTIFEVDNKSLTNRPDLWGHYGIAREFSALTGRPLKPYKRLDCSRFANLPPVALDIQDCEHAYRYSSIKVENITTKVSPVNMRIRLFYCGTRAINFLTDLTNYLMLELGQPMHAFDLRKVDQIEVKRFAEPFEFETLDSIKRKIDENTLMICSHGDPVAIAGIMGGLDSSIFDDTTSLLLESACFDSVSVRKSSTRLGLRTDASMRYEKTLDPELCVAAVERLLYLLFEINPEARVISSLSDKYVKRYDTITLDFDKKYVDRYTGIDISNDQIVKTLTSLGFDVTQKGDDFKVTVPSWRATKDVTITADIIEEITRIYGYDNFKITTASANLHPVLESMARNNDNQVKDILVRKYNLHEVHSYIWCDSKRYNELGIDVEENVKVLNAMTVENSVLRNSMGPTLLNFAFENKNYAPDFGIFEIGRVVKGYKPDGLCNERKTLGILLFGHTKSEKELFFFLRDMLATLAYNIKHTEITFKNLTPSHNWQHPKNTVGINLYGEQIGVICTIHPECSTKIDKKASIVFAELDMDSFAEAQKQALSYTEVSKYPSIEFDLSFVIKDNTRYSEIATAWEEENFEHLKGASLTDVYEGEQKSISVRLYFSSKEKTLTRAEILPFIEKIIAKLADKGINLKQ